MENAQVHHVSQLLFIPPIADCSKSVVLTMTLIQRYTGYSSIHQMRSKRLMERRVHSLTVLSSAEC